MMTVPAIARIRPSAWTEISSAAGRPAAIAISYRQRKKPRSGPGGAGVVSASRSSLLALRASRGRRNGMLTVPPIPGRARRRAEALVAVGPAEPVAAGRNLPAVLPGQGVLGAEQLVVEPDQPPPQPGAQRGATTASAASLPVAAGRRLRRPDPVPLRHPSTSHPRYSARMPCATFKVQHVT